MRTKEQIESQLYIAHRISQNLVKCGVRHHMFHDIQVADPVKERNEKAVILIFTDNCEMAIEPLRMPTGLGFHVHERANGKLGEYTVLKHKQVDVIVTPYHHEYRHLCDSSLQAQPTCSARIYDIVDIVTDGKFTPMHKENKQDPVELAKVVIHEYHLSNSNSNYTECEFNEGNCNRLLILYANREFEELITAISVGCNIAFNGLDAHLVVGVKDGLAVAIVKDYGDSVYLKKVAKEFIPTSVSIYINKEKNTAMAKQITIEERFAAVEAKLQDVIGKSKLHWNKTNIIRPVDDGNDNAVFHRALAIISMQARKVAKLLSDKFTVQFTDYHGIVFLGFIDELPVRVYQMEDYDISLEKVNDGIVAAGSLHRSMCLPHELNNCPDRSFVSKQSSYALANDILATLTDCGIVITGTTGGFKADDYDFIMTISGNSIEEVEKMLKDVYGINLVPLAERYAIGFIGKVIIVTRNKNRPYVKHKHKNKDIFDIVRLFVNEGKDEVVDNTTPAVEVASDDETSYGTISKIRDALKDIVDPHDAQEYMLKSDVYDCIYIQPTHAIDKVTELLLQRTGIKFIYLGYEGVFGFKGKLIVVVCHEFVASRIKTVEGLELFINTVNHLITQQGFIPLITQDLDKGVKPVLADHVLNEPSKMAVSDGPSDKLLEETAEALKHPDAIGRVYTGTTANELPTVPMDPVVEEIIVTLQELKIFNTSLEANINFKGYTKILRVSNLHYDGRQVSAVDITNILKGKFDKVFEVDFYIGRKAVVLFHKYVMVLFVDTRGPANFPLDELTQCVNLIEDHVKSEKAMNKRNDKTVHDAKKEASTVDQTKVAEELPVIDIVRAMAVLEFSCATKQYDFSHSKYKRVLYINDVRNARNERLYAGYVAGCLSKILSNIVFEEAKCSNTYFFAFYHDLIVVIGDEVFNGNRLSGEVYYLCYNATSAVDMCGSGIDFVQRGAPVVFKRDVLGQGATKKSDDAAPVVIEHELVSEELAQMVDRINTVAANTTAPAPKQNWNRHVMGGKSKPNDHRELYNHLNYSTRNESKAIMHSLIDGIMKYNNMLYFPAYEEVRNELIDTGPVDCPMILSNACVKWFAQPLFDVPTCYFEIENGGPDNTGHILRFANDDKHFVIGMYTGVVGNVECTLINVYELVNRGTQPAKNVTIEWLLDVLNS